MTEQKILVVDDEQSIIDVVVYALEIEGFQTMSHWTVKRG